MTLELRDVSEFNAWTDPSATAVSGVVGIIAKATEGHGFIDPTWAAHRAAMLAGPFVPGCYHFSRPDLGNPPDAEAEWFLGVANPSDGWLLFHDAESAGGSLAWCDEFEQHCAALLGGYHVGFYSYEAWMESRGIIGSPLLQRSPLWFAWPDSNGPLPFTCAMQQYGAGPSPGFSGDVDLNRFFGDRRQLARLTIGGGTRMATQMYVQRTADGTTPADPGVWLTDGLSRRGVPSPGEKVGLDVLPGLIDTQIHLMQAETVDNIPVSGFAAVDVAAIVTALLPHLTATVDVAALATALEAVLPGADAKAFEAELAAQLAKP